MSSSMSLYIPYVFSNVTKDKIIYTFEFHLRLGHIKEVDLVAKIGKGKHYYSAYIHFEEWYNNDKALRFIERIKNPLKETRVVYDTPETWYWVVLENKSKKVVPGQRKQCIDVIDLINYKYKSPEKNVSTNELLCNLYPCAPIKKVKEEEVFDEFHDYLHLPSPVKEKEQDDLYDISLNLISEFSCGYDIESNLNDNDKKDSLNDDYNLMYDYDIESKINDNDKEDEINDTIIDNNYIDPEYVKFLEQENMKLQNGMGDVVDYFERCGFAEHRNKMLEDELSCLKLKLSILEERGVVDPEIYY